MNKFIHTIFTFWDFVKDGEVGKENKSLIRPYDACLMAQKAFDKYLKEHGRHVWGFKTRSGWYESKHFQDESHYSAYLIGIEETLDACKHPPERVHCMQTGYRCECGKDMKPSMFSEK